MILIRRLQSEKSVAIIKRLKNINVVNSPNTTLIILYTAVLTGKLFNDPGY